MALGSIANPVAYPIPNRKRKRCGLPGRWVMRKALGVAGMAWAAGAAPMGLPIADSAAIPNSALMPDTVFNAMDTLFLTAATGEPRLQTARDSCEKALMARDTQTVAYLLSRNVAAQTPRQRRYTEKLFGLLSDSGRKAEPGLALAKALALMPDSLKPHWLYIASTMGDKALGQLGLVYIRHPHSEVRCMAARLLGAYPDSSHAQALLGNLDETAEAERHQRLWALAAIFTQAAKPAPKARIAQVGMSSPSTFPGCESLRNYLSDSSLAIRQMAVSALSACVGKDFARLRPPNPKQLLAADNRALLAWMDLAEAIATPDSRAWAEKAGSSLSPRARLFQGGVMYNGVVNP